MKKWSLKRTTQCAKCPWRKDVDPTEIPNGYCRKKHCDLKSTISSGLDSLGSHKAMACHENDDAHCVGWLVNQAGTGNNLGLRLRLMSCENAGKIKLLGEQHERFEDTIPDEL